MVTLCGGVYMGEGREGKRKIERTGEENEGKSGGCAGDRIPALVQQNTRNNVEQ